MSEENKRGPGELCWVELMTSDTEAAKKLYAELFDWNPQTQEMGGVQYTVLMSARGGRIAAGVSQPAIRHTPVPSSPA